MSLAKADSSNTERREANSRTFESMDNRPGTFREWQRITDGMILTAYNDVSVDKPFYESSATTVFERVGMSAFTPGSGS